MQNTKEFIQEQPPINIGADISVRSFEMIEEELQDYPKAKEFDENEIEVISRLIHTSTCFDEVLNNICFTKDAIPRIQKLLLNKAKIIVDVNMIKVGLSDFYLKTYENEVVCYINEPFTYEMAEKNKTTRSYAAVVEAIKKRDPIAAAEAMADHIGDVDCEMDIISRNPQLIQSMETFNSLISEQRKNKNTTKSAGVGGTRASSRY